MSFALWSSTYETGHPEVDQQHQQLFRMINDLQEAMSRGKGREALGPVLQSLVGYTLEHFATEEALMRASGYPSLARHAEKHAVLARQVSELALRFSEGFLTIPNTLSRFLFDWLKLHIREEDSAFIAWLKGQSPRE
jgi:hemerythrin